MLFLDVTKKDGLLQQTISYYEIAKRTYDFVMTYVGNRTINVTLAMPFLVGNKKGFVYIQARILG